MFVCFIICFITNCSQQNPVGPSTQPTTIPTIAPTVAPTATATVVPTSYTGFYQPTTINGSISLPQIHIPIGTPFTCVINGKNIPAPATGLGGYTYTGLISSGSYQGEIGYEADNNWGSFEICWTWKNLGGPNPLNTPGLYFTVNW